MVQNREAILPHDVRRYQEKLFVGGDSYRFLGAVLGLSVFAQVQVLLRKLTQAKSLVGGHF